MIDQLTVFLENTEGRLTALCRTLGDAGIDMHALVVADTTDYGIVRIICDSPVRAVEELGDAGFRAMTAKVVAVEVPDVPGGLGRVFGALEGEGLNIEYSYCFANARNGATVAIKAPERAVAVLEAAGFRVLHTTDLYKNVE